MFTPKRRNGEAERETGFSATIVRHDYDEVTNVRELWQWIDEVTEFLIFVLSFKIAGRMRRRANPSAYDSFCLLLLRSILDYRDQLHAGEPVELKSSRRLRHSRPQSGASPCPGHLGLWFR